MNNSIERSKFFKVRRKKATICFYVTHVINVFQNDRDKTSDICEEFDFAEKLFVEFDAIRKVISRHGSFH